MNLDIENITDRELSENILKSLILINWKIEKLSHRLSKTDIEFLSIDTPFLDFNNEQIEDQFNLLEGFSNELIKVELKIKEMYKI